MSDEQKTVNTAAKSKDLVLEKADSYAHEIYKLSRLLPKEELYGIRSQLTRAGLSVPLNIVEGFARQSAKQQRQFLLISFGSLKETQYIIKFSVEEGLFSKKEIAVAYRLGDNLGGMLWNKIKTLNHA